MCVRLHVSPAVPTFVSRYRICAMSNDIIVLEEILGYVLEALDVIEVPKNRNVIFKLGVVRLLFCA